MRIKKVSIFLLVLVLILIVPSKLYAAGPSLEFNPSQITLAKGDSYSIEVVADPAGNSLVGVDMIVGFDSTLIKVLDVGSLEVFTSKSAEIIDNDKGVLKIAFSNSYGVFTKEKAAIAELKIEAKKDSGTTSLEFDFAEGDTKDTNMVISEGRDVLESVNSLIVGLSSGTTTASLSVESGEVEGAQESVAIDYPKTFADDDTEIVSGEEDQQNSDTVLGKSADVEENGSILDDIGRKILPSQPKSLRSVLKVVITILTTIILLTIAGFIGYRLGKKESSS